MQRLELTLKVALIVLAALFLLSLARHSSATPTPASTSARLRAIANQIEESDIPNKSDIAERVEALSAEVLATQENAN